MQTSKIFVLCLFVAISLICPFVVTAQESSILPLNVLDFGAKGGGTTDNTAAFQNALEKAAASSVQTVFVPRGNYRFDGSLNFPQGVTLKGVWESVPAHNGIRDRGLIKPTEDGTTFLVCGNAGAEEKEPFLTLNTNCTLKGVCIYYPDQLEDDVPIAYPWTIAMRGKNPAILDCELLNVYKGIDTTTSERHLIRNISGQPLRMGVFVDAIYDIGRIENVHFNPWWSMKPKLFSWQMANGEAFVFGRTDWQYVFNTFCFGYDKGYRFIETKTGATNGNFLGIGADDCQTALQVDQSAPMGILITNGEFVSFHGPDPTMIRVLEGNQGSIRFVNCAFWGPCRQIAVIDGKGTVGFSDCTFVQWGFQDKANDNGKERVNVPAIQALGGNVMILGCEFQEDRYHIQMGEKIRKAVIANNLFRGKMRIENEAGERPSIVLSANVADE